ncbi:hypothetical protein GO730_10360 [Spirosoma sp. HMF3257]|uniref:Uncharacterized protein n=1 Tax=Spirosoma telluris TaxID=2183553 RepID=A0A327NHC2_9BACT|nr:hypothetical protein [Spirosoma telluris]RAI74557.1 hypothetical protein HMF3257_10270 [Spirosoma telluris]
MQPCKPIVGFALGFSDDGSAYQKEWTVTQVVEGQKLAHIWAYKDYRGRSEVAFEQLVKGITPGSGIRAWKPFPGCPLCQTTI